jgi:hypothetical protein
MVGSNLTLWVAGVTMVKTEGKAGDRTALLFTNCLIPQEKGEVWKRIRDFKEVSGKGTSTDIPKDLEF